MYVMEPVNYGVREALVWCLSGGIHKEDKDSSIVDKPAGGSSFSTAFPTSNYRTSSSCPCQSMSECRTMPMAKRCL